MRSNLTSFIFWNSSVLTAAEILLKVSMFEVFHGDKEAVVTGKPTVSVDKQVIIL